ncbi:hypothetical protein AB0I28_04770 [Phytomonospora sp. NPDC050363]|uniref:hypothetical protein n=1 Tax=Phytomonospora sp. NPDC050363 TaxID=3155642 RepID=UPI0033E1D33B
MSTMRHWDGDPHCRLIIAPGMGYTADAPLLWYARVAALNAGWSVTDLNWAGSASDIDGVNAGVAQALDEKPATTTVLLAKSLGTLSVSTAADRGVAGIWLTPLLAGDGPRQAHVRANLPSLFGPQLHIGGTADDLWDRTLVPAGHAVLEIPGADHAMHIAGDVLGTIDVARQVTERIMTFMDTVCHGTATA